MNINFSINRTLIAWLAGFLVQFPVGILMVWILESTGARADFGGGFAMAAVVLFVISGWLIARALVAGAIAWLCCRFITNTKHALLAACAANSALVIAFFIFVSFLINID
jgi:hypothetical protein